MASRSELAERRLFAWLGLLFVNLELFLVVDWNEGPARVGLLGTLTLLLLAWRRWVVKESATEVSARSLKIARVLLVIGVIANVSPWLYYVTFTARTGTLRSDQAQTVQAALKVLRDGVNPYAHDTVTDSFAYDLATEDLDAHPTCREPAAAATQFRVGRADPTVVPDINDRPECTPLRKLFASLGFKYGPVMLLAYLPFITLLGPTGFLASHLLLITGYAWLLFARAHRGTSSTFWATIVVLPFLFPTELAWNVLAVEHLDVVPVLLVTAAWLCWDTERYGLAAACIGVSVAMKFLPGLLFVPLLVRGPRRYWALPLVIAAACFAPFVLWDREGLIDNVGYPFSRPPDTTSLAYFLSPALRLVLRALAVTGVSALAIRAYGSGWDRVKGIEYLFFTHLLVIASGTAFHNNYIVWLLPLISLYLIETLKVHAVPRAELHRE